MKKLVGIVVIGIMFLSSLAFAAVQGFDSGSTQQQQAAQAELPSQLIIDYRMSSAQFNEVLSRGFTVATYKYDKGCVQCIDERRLIEQLVLSREFQNQIILEEVEQSGPSELEIASYLGRKKIDKIDTNSTLKAFCELVASPPVGCVLR